MERAYYNETVCFTNMCVVFDSKGNVLALDKVKGNYTGTTFPGGHVEKEETFYDSIIREIWEETGLTIEEPQMCGVYHWHADGIHNVIFVYRADHYTGSLKSSDEGKVYWIPIETFRQKELAIGTEHVLDMAVSGTIMECYMKKEGEMYKGTLY